MFVCVDRHEADIYQRLERFAPRAERQGAPAGVDGVGPGTSGAPASTRDLIQPLQACDLGVPNPDDPHE
jgi:hypothetical protein